MDPDDFDDNVFGTDDFQMGVSEVDGLHYSAVFDQRADLYKITIHDRAINVLTSVDEKTGRINMTARVVRPDDPAWEYVPDEQTV